MKIKQSVLNTMKRIGFDPAQCIETEEKEVVENRFGGGSCETYPYIARLIEWVYRTSNQFELEFDHRGKVPTIADFDRIRYFIAEVDPVAYQTCID